MPRKARRKSRSGIYHIMLRGINKQTIFEEDEDKRRFLETLKKYKAICNYQIYSYCLMNNHVHLLLKETDESISIAIKRISSSYVYWYNSKYERYGHLFQGRFKSENVEDQTYFLTVLRYIHQNPMKAGLAKTVLESKWTSINEYLFNADIVDIDFALDLFSSERNKAIQMFMTYMQQQNHDQCLDDRVKVRMTDHEVKEYLCKWGITNNSELQQMEKDKRDAVLVKLKKLKGVTIRQLSRITGISKSVIHRAR
ncbi:REP element-mobilizing transposase RayT [Oikeobacillus pervagus]|uniref:REP element-mobilizing transposase RayT n=1 Tax=Oikeobacillus pervagus TaxID=1325931 RepID=A0AAJ1SZY9_9BACI|nr:transposase [Oikeobacillus pervagus]MDQ0215903.1 REP element-mobilizing transposase RayT [Oikeobacillus pervagus]